ncbi:hypothetical protein Hanom_Chr11g01047631 [Helianthus anomalus]
MGILWINGGMQISKNTEHVKVMIPMDEGVINLADALLVAARAFLVTVQPSLSQEPSLS